MSTWVLQTLMADRASAPELRSYGLRDFLLRMHARVMGAQTAEELAVARRVTTTTKYRMFGERLAAARSTTLR